MSRGESGKRIPGSVVLFLFVMLIFDGILAWMVKEQLEVARWPTAPGMIEDVSTELRSGSTSSEILECPEVSFRYEVEGQSYRSDTWRPGDYCSSDPRDADRLLEDLELGGEVLVYYDPDDPGRAYLSAGFGRVEHTGLLFFLPFNLFALGWVLEILSILVTGRQLEQGRLRFREEMSRTVVVFPRLGPLRFALGIMFALSFLLIFPAFFLFSGIPASLYPWIWWSLAALFIALFGAKALWNQLNLQTAIYDQRLEELRLPRGRTFARSEIEGWRIEEVRSGKSRAQFGVELVLREPGGELREGAFPLLETREEADRLCDWLVRILEPEERSSARRESEDGR